MRVSVVQMRPGADKAANIAQAGKLLEAVIGEERPDIVALPEMWTCPGGDRGAKFREGGRTCPPWQRRPRWAGLRAPARHGAGQRHPRPWRIDRRARGRASVQHRRRLRPGRGGGWRATARSIFSASSPPDGTGYRESAICGAGDAVVTVPIDGVQMGLAICYGLRFPELRRRGAELVFLPPAFTPQTGKDHRAPLIRARAIEVQCRIAAPAVTGAHRDAKGRPRPTYGHSMVCAPRGHVVARCPGGPGAATARVDPAPVARVRRDMPVMELRRLA